MIRHRLCTNDVWLCCQDRRRQETRHSRCSLLTSPDNAALTSVLPTFSLPSVTQLTKFILDLDSQLESKKLSLNRCYPLTNPNLPLYSIDGKPLWFNLRFTGDLDVSDTAIQKMNPLTDVHYFTVGPRGKYLVEEQMSGSTLLFYIPSKLCSAYIRHFDFANKLMSSLPKSDQTNQMEVLRRALVHVAEYLREVCGQLSAGIDKSTCSKKSDWKNDKWSSFLSLNMQIYSVKLFQVEMPDLETLDSIAEQNQCIDYFVTSQEITNDNRKLDQPTDLKASEVRHWDVLTVGGPTPHALDSSGTGRSLIRFEELAKLHLEVTKYLLKQDAEHGNVRDMYAGFGLSFTDVFIRRDLAVLSLIVTPLCTSLMRALETHKSDELFWKILVNTRKVHFSWLSLINDSGDEREMMRDFIAAVNYVNRYVKFIFVEGDNGFFPLIDIDLLGDILVTIYLPNNEGLPDKRSVFVSKYLKHGKHLQFDCCVHFLNQRLIPAPSGTDTTGATNALGDEREMMRDFIAAVNYVNRYVKFIFVEGDNGFFPLIDIDLLGDILVTIYLPNNEGLPDKRSVFVSKYLKHGKHLQFDCCVHFLNQRLIPAPSGTDTTGATNALGAVGKLSSLQVEIFRDLHDSFITGHLTETIEKLAHTFGQNNEVERLKSSKEKLSQCILSSEYLDRSAKFPPAIDHINEFIVASRLSRCIRLCSCKSAKDRTAMGATYEMAELICEYIDSVQKSSRFQPGDQIRGALLDSLRRGVRLRNCKMNAGLPKYKFTSLNQRLMPQVFKPPEGTYTGSNSVST
ncbi:uncharacterized protein LOC134847575 isoform X2 [Symsagittifera roscoffensis]|uniref:uncharacterized protein LOC134847575 isoform X2 n=1 Tax=Symsagittifera roscoffensis TaxID=84072 RepID=UPI00307BC741